MNSPLSQHRQGDVFPEQYFSDHAISSSVLSMPSCPWVDVKAGNYGRIPETQGLYYYKVKVEDTSYRGLMWSTSHRGLMWSTRYWGLMYRTLDTEG